MDAAVTVTDADADASARNVTVFLFHFFFLVPIVVDDLPACQVNRHAPQSWFQRSWGGVRCCYTHQGDIQLPAMILSESLLMTRPAPVPRRLSADAGAGAGGVAAETPPGYPSLSLKGKRLATSKAGHHRHQHQRQLHGGRHYHDGYHDRRSSLGSHHYHQQQYNNVPHHRLHRESSSMSLSGRGLGGDSRPPSASASASPSVSMVAGPGHRVMQRPAWPKSAPTIPSTFVKDGNKVQSRKQKKNSFPI